MARTRKNTRRKTRRPHRDLTLPIRLAWLGGGLAGGLLLGYAGYYLMNLPDRPSAPTEVATPAPRPPPAPEPPPAEIAPAPEPAAPRFDFYTLLPEMEVEITDDKLSEALQALPQSGDRGPYILQIGSFRRHDEADNLKARLALLGIEAEIQTVVVREGDRWFRVRVGPYDSLRDLSQVRNRLNRNNIQFMVLRLDT